MIDLHCHILPGLDDGAETPKEALEMAEIAYNDGVKTIVATPHVYDENYQSATEVIVPAVKKLQSLIAAKKMSLKLIAGAEIRIAPELPQYIKSGRIPTIGMGGKYIVIELPFNDIPSYLARIIFELRIVGVTPILAHPERNELIIRNPNLLLPWLEKGVLTQINTGSLLGTFGEKIAKVTEVLITHDMAHLVGTDAHTARGSRKPIISIFKETLAHFTGPDRIRELTELNPESVISGRPVRRRNPKEYRLSRKSIWDLALGGYRK